MGWIVFRWGGWPALALFLYAFDPGGWFSDAPEPTPSASVSEKPNATPVAAATPIPTSVPTQAVARVLEVSTPGVIHIDFNWNGKFDGAAEAVTLAACNVKDAFVSTPEAGSWQAKALAELRQRLTGKLVSVEWSGDRGYVLAPDGELVNARVLGSGYAWHAEDTGSKATRRKADALKAIEGKKGLYAE
jgi:endonuclease YncB( thermonuclease family)